MKGSVAILTMLAALAVAPAGHARGKQCVEVSEIVGRQKCSRYGSKWSTEGTLPIALGVSARYLAFAPMNHTFTGSFKHDGGTASLQYGGASLGRSLLETSGIGVRITGVVLPGVYAGIEYGAGLGRIQPGAFSAGGASFQPNGSLVNAFSISAGALVGARLPLGRLSARAELLLGGYTLSVDQAVSKDGFVNGSTPMGAASWAVEPRGAVDVWLTPWATLSASYGRNLIDRQSQTAGLALTWHVRSYDGVFSL